MRTILVSDDVSDNGLQPLRDAGFTVDRKTKLSVAELRAALAGCEGLIVRSETKVTAGLLEAARNFRVIGRGGVCGGNIDGGAATAAGILLMNAPAGKTNTTS